MEAKFKEGDRVEYFDGGECAVSGFLGRRGAIVSLDSPCSALVKWDDNGCDRVLLANLWRESSPVITPGDWVTVSDGGYRSPHYARVLAVVGDSAWIDGGRGPGSGVVVAVDTLAKVAA